MIEKTLSVFIDESGDFGAYDHHAPYYIVAMVLHDQSADIRENIQVLDRHQRELGWEPHAIHTGPIIRRESIYENVRMEERKKLFNALFHFSRRLEFQYICTLIEKRECPDTVAMTAKLSRRIADMLRSHEEYFQSFDRIIVYYDNGQIELTKILTSVFNTLFDHVEFRKVSPADYKLFQVADLICTVELTSHKFETGQPSHSELEFFHSARELRKNYLKSLERKRL